MMVSSRDLWQVMRERLSTLFSEEAQRSLFFTRMEGHFASLVDLLSSLYGERPDFVEQLERICVTTAQAFIERPLALHMLDASRDERWFQSERVVGGVCYVDLYAGNLAGIRARIPYFEELGLTYLHLMPLFRMPVPFNDGGYAVSSFREVRPELGTMEELAELATELRAHGISLVLDFVMNHTSDEHEWALRAKAGDTVYQGYYWMFPDETMPRRYSQTLREIFPEHAPGSFTYVAEAQRWVWTTFHPYQWDLNYANPALFNAMLGEMLFLANQGVEVLRLDAVPFIWKQLGTNCENLPQAHELIAAFNVLMRVAAPATVFKAEAIVHPDEIAKYIGRECEISYNPLLMVLLWEALATTETRLLQYSMKKRFAIPANAAWVNYVRSHDDIGWGFANEDCAEIGIDAWGHRNFLNDFYTGRFGGSFANGLPFGYNPQTNDMRICGTTASLAGLEQALHRGDTVAIGLAIQRILAIMGVIFAAGGIPLLYLGDEVGTLNDYGYQHDSSKSYDNRWVHRPFANEETLKQRHDAASVAGRIFGPIQHMIALRKANAIFAATWPTYWLDSGNGHLALFMRQMGQEAIYVAANFSAQSQMLDMRRFATNMRMTDMLSETMYESDQPMMLPPYGLVWLRC